MVGGRLAGGLDGDAAFFREGEERFSAFFRYEGQVDGFWGEGPLVGAAEQEQCFGEVDRSGVDGVEAVDEFAVGAVVIVAGHVEKIYAKLGVSSRAAAGLFATEHGLLASASGGGGQPGLDSAAPEHT